MNIICITDQNHGWGIVSAEQLKAARMTENDISAFSYCTPNREIYALEEDVDFPKYLNKLDAMGIRYESKTTISLMKNILTIRAHGNMFM